MSEHEMSQENENNEDVNVVSENDDSLDLGSTPEDEFDPFAASDLDDELADEPEKPKASEKPKEAEKPSKPVTKKDTDKNDNDSADNPLAKAMDAAETKEAEEAQKSLFTKSPVFEYAGATEEIEDTSKTFEDLRIEKSSDFPELEDGKRVSWTVEYGKITKTVPNPKETSISKMKSEIETSKAFLDALKKSKDKEPACKLKPRVTAQSKGKESSYKGVYTSIEDAESSGKVITLFPAKDGNVYEMRKNEMGRFITPSIGSDMLSEVESGFTPALPPIPFEHLLDILSFFRAVAHKGNYEALVNVYWDKVEQKYIVDVPEQVVTSVSVDCEPNPSYDNERYIHYMDIHSHNSMKAFFSAKDNNDEKATRVYAVIGKIFDYFPQIKVRISNGGTFLPIEPGEVFDGFDFNSDIAKAWEEQLKVRVSDDIPYSKRTDKAFKKFLKGFRGCDME